MKSEIKAEVAADGKVYLDKSGPITKLNP